MINVENVHKSFKLEGNDLTQNVLTDINFQIEQTKFNIIIGKSGSGKSTLINILAGLDNADSGKVTIFANEISKYTGEEAAKFRLENVGIVFQFFNLLPTLSILENVALPAYLRGRSKGETLENAQVLLARVGLSHVVNKLPNQVSGGEIQRAAIARALINQPKIILADEPTGNLDAKNSEIILNLFKELIAERNVLTLIATHDSSLIEKADNVLEIVDGKIK